ncbi:MAG: response regulator [Aggregatilineales bacterium]
MAAPHALIIDDDPNNVEVLSMMLSREGITSTTLHSPRGLAEILRVLAHFDLVFVDLEFPDGDGYTVLSELKADQRFMNVPIVAYTVHISSIDKARRAGFHSFLGKPLNSRYFSGQIKRILNHQAVWEV